MLILKLSTHICTYARVDLNTGEEIDNRVEKIHQRDSTVSEEFEEKTATTTGGRTRANTREYQSKRRAKTRPPGQRRSKRAKVKKRQLWVERRQAFLYWLILFFFYSDPDPVDAYRRKRRTPTEDGEAAGQSLWRVCVRVGWSQDPDSEQSEKSDIYHWRQDCT